MDVSAAVPGASIGCAFSLSGGIRVLATGDPHAPLVRRFFEGYDRAFVLPDEREDLAGFETCLALNRTHKHLLGRTHCERVAVLEDETGARLAGANFLAVRHGQSGRPRATVALNYIYVEPSVRGRGLLRLALSAVRTLSLAALDLDPVGTSLTLFIEQNDPLRLTPAAYAADTEHSGLDQVDRLAIWQRIGARIVDFPYVQPALSLGQRPDDTLIYAAIDHPDATVEAGLLHDHLQSFFVFSVLKGEALRPGDVASSQLAALAARTRPVPLLPMGAALDWLRSGRSTQAFDRFRDLARKVGDR